MVDYPDEVPVAERFDHLGRKERSDGKGKGVRRSTLPVRASGRMINVSVNQPRSARWFQQASEPPLLLSASQPRSRQKKMAS